MEENNTPKPSNNSMYYVVGAVVVAAILAAGYFLRPQAPAPAGTDKMQGETMVTTQSGAQSTPATGPITKLGCEQQYYNPVVGFKKYYLTTEGVDVSGVESVDCTFTVSVAGRVVATESASSPMTDQPQRGGGTFRCSTTALELEPNIATKVSVDVKDNNGATVACNKTFLLP